MKVKIFPGGADPACQETQINGWLSATPKMRIVFVTHIATPAAYEGKRRTENIAVWYEDSE